jgi:hypothetical protein
MKEKWKKEIFDMVVLFGIGGILVQMKEERRVRFF